MKHSVEFFKYKYIYTHTYIKRSFIRCEFHNSGMLGGVDGGLLNGVATFQTVFTRESTGLYHRINECIAPTDGTLNFQKNIRNINHWT